MVFRNSFEDFFQIFKLVAVYDENGATDKISDAFEPAWNVVQMGESDGFDPDAQDR